MRVNPPTGKIRAKREVVRAPPIDKEEALMILGFEKDIRENLAPRLIL